MFLLLVIHTETISVHHRITATESTWPSSLHWLYVCTSLWIPVKMTGQVVVKSSPAPYHWASAPHSTPCGYCILKLLSLHFCCLASKVPCFPSRPFRANGWITLTLIPFLKQEITSNRKQLVYLPSLPYKIFLSFLPMNQLHPNP